MRFVDTNVLLYAISRDPRDARKSSVARALLTEPDLVLSVQVLQEFFVQATRAARAERLPQHDAVALINSWQRFPVQELNVGVVMRAIEASARWQISYWDAAVVESARAAGCRTLLSEDLQHKQFFDGVQVIDPFR